MMKRLLTFLFFLAPLAVASFFSPKSQFLPVDEAFTFELSQQNDQVTLHWDIADNYWLYQKFIKVEAKNAELGENDFPEAEDHEDPYFGKMQIYRHALNLQVPLLSTADNPELLITFQGCTDGLCYPPTTKSIPLLKVENSTSTTNTNSTNDNRFLQTLNHSNYAYLWFFLFGLGLSFTPCVLPMLPLLSSLVIGQNKRPSTMKAFLLSLSYVQGMALTYTLLGLMVAAVGLPFQIALQSPAVLITLSVIFVLLSLSMFGLYDLTLPNALQNKLINLSQRQQGGAFFGVFVMGMVAGLVASPCTSAPVSAALLYVARSGNLVTGGMTLYLLALGMGLPLMLITIFGNRFLPKSGGWLNLVKGTFGFVMLAMPIILLSRLMPTVWEWRLWSLLVMIYGLWLGVRLKGKKPATVFGKIFSFSLAILAAYPLQLAIWQNLAPQAFQSIEKIETTQTQWQKATTLNELRSLLKNNQKPYALIDFYADWCVACKELDEETFANPKVQQALEDTLLIRVDVTKNNPDNQALLNAYQILGLPAVLSFEKEKERFDLRLSGFEKAEDFLKRLQQR